MDPLAGDFAAGSSSNRLVPSELSEQELWNGQIVLQRACGRAQGGRRETRRKYFCLAGQILNTEAVLRGLPTPAPKDSYGQMQFDPGYDSR